MATVAGTMPLAQAREEQIRRFDTHQIIQHAGLMVTFILLVLSGMPLKFSEAGVSQWWAAVWGGIDNLRLLHRVAAWGIVVVCLYHLVYIWYTTAVLKRPFPYKMIPSLQDFIKFFQEMAYFLGLRREEPEWDRFNWREKFDYWAIFWGMPVIGISGFIMMFPVQATNFLPGWVLPTALVAHSDEAMLALTWIFVVHIFFNHFSPRVFPFNKSIFTGKVPRERYRREHALEYAAMTGEGKESDETDTGNIR
ncbi:MAG: cytochrome b/b6 domain-containing protein [Chloroflexi bacterium]|nr:cytochrome b/b6 domain-containing protein [Chloroflexota bacterium]